MILSVCFLMVFISLTYGKADKLLDGNWTNKLGSKIKLETHLDGTITGFYQTAVVSEKEKNALPPTSPISGTYRVTQDGILIAFNVQWQYEDLQKPGSFKHSVTSWSGKLFGSKPDKWTATWILVKDGSINDLWQNVLTNQDQFKRAD